MYEYNAIVKKVLDANTLELTVDLGFGVTIKRVFHAVGMNAPIFRGNENDATKIEAAVEAKNTAKDLILGKKVQIVAQKMAKYGRYEVAVFSIDDGKSYNDLMAEKGY